MTNAVRRHEGLISILGLVAVLTIARGLDAILEALRRRNAVTFDLPYAILWSQTVIALVLAALLLLLAWFVILRAPRNPWISALYLLAGSLLVLGPQIYFTPALAVWIPEFLFTSVASRGSYLFTAGGFIAVIGLLSLSVPQRLVPAVK